MSLLYCLVFSLWPCDLLLGKGGLPGSLVGDVFLFLSLFLSLDVSGQMWCLILTILDLCILLYFFADESIGVLFGLINPLETGNL